MSSPVTLDEVLARNVRTELEARGLRHEDLAARMRTHGLRWSANTVAQVVGMRRHVSLLEAAGLCSALQVPLAQLLAGDDLITVPALPVPVPLSQIRAVLDRGVAPRGSATTTVTMYEPDEAEVKAARRLGVDVGVLMAASERLFGTPSVSEERDRRVGDTAGLTRRELQAKRGHAMRAVLAELDQHLARRTRRRRR